MTTTQAATVIYTATSRLYEITNDVLSQTLTADAWTELRKIDDALEAIRKNEGDTEDK